MSTHKHASAEIEVIRYGEVVNIDIEAIIHPASRGSRDRYGLAYEPDEPEEIEITEVAALAHVSKWSDLTSAEQEEALEAIRNSASAFRP
jgi:hypothetical protein